MGKVKLIIILNMAVPFPLGRLCAMCAHAATAAILDRGYWSSTYFCIEPLKDEALRIWMEESFTKVICKVWGEDKLIQMKEMATFNNIHTSMIEEDGHLAALSIGPAFKEDLRFTKELILL